MSCCDKFLFVLVMVGCQPQLKHLYSPKEQPEGLDRPNVEEAQEWAETEPQSVAARPARRKDLLRSRLSTLRGGYRSVGR